MGHNAGVEMDRAMLERTSSMPSSDCVAGARAIAPLIAEHAAEIEQTQAFPPAVLDALHEARLFRMLIPKSCDGWEADPLSYLQVELLARRRKKDGRQKDKKKEPGAGDREKLLYATLLTINGIAAGMRNTG